MFGNSCEWEDVVVLHVNVCIVSACVCVVCMHMCMYLKILRVRWCLTNETIAHQRAGPKRIKFGDPFHLIMLTHFKVNELGAMLNTPMCPES